MKIPARLGIFAHLHSSLFSKGFTLAELLIALGILGVIATFTIPKVLSSQQDSKYKSIAKEAAAMMSEAYTTYKLRNQVSGSFNLADLTPYLNYVKRDTSTNIDSVYTGDDWPCSNTEPCMLLHNGARLHYFPVVTFNGTASTNAIYFHLDPDGVYGGTTQGPGKAVPFFLYYSGKITDEGNILPNTQNSDDTFNPDPGIIPPWFRWN